MGWIIRVGGISGEADADGANTKPFQCVVTSKSNDTVVQLNGGSAMTLTGAGYAASKSARQVEKVWQNVLSTLVGV